MKQKYCPINLFVPNTPFLYPLKTSENRKVKRSFTFKEDFIDFREVLQKSLKFIV